eukprot:3607220-Karenia_brevis.AAC.1
MHESPVAGTSGILTLGEAERDQLQRSHLSMREGAVAGTSGNVTIDASERDQLQRNHLRVHREP